MEHTPPPLPISTTGNCKWCSKPMSSEAIRCPSCGKLRKDIYKQKIICYTFCIAGGLLVAFGGPMIKEKKQDFAFNNTDTSSENGAAYLMLIVGVIAALIGLWYYIKVSRKLKTYRWM